MKTSIHEQPRAHEYQTRTVLASLKCCSCALAARAHSDTDERDQGHGRQGNPRRAPAERRQPVTREEQVKFLLDPGLSVAQGGRHGHLAIGHAVSRTVGLVSKYPGHRTDGLGYEQGHDALNAVVVRSKLRKTRRKAFCEHGLRATVRSKAGIALGLAVGTAIGRDGLCAGRLTGGGVHETNESPSFSRMLCVLRNHVHRVCDGHRNRVRSVGCRNGGNAQIECRAPPHHAKQHPVVFDGHGHPSQAKGVVLFGAGTGRYEAMARFAPALHFVHVTNERQRPATLWRVQHAATTIL